jgi:uncharacterized protein (TIGR03435 family)
VHSLSDRYQIEATAAGATERSVLMGAMLRTLLEERFKLTVHRETEMVDMLELRLSKGGLKLAPMKDGDCDGDPTSVSGPPPVDPAGKPRCGGLSMMNADGNVRWTFGGMPLASLARRLSSHLKVFVIDGTGVKDSFVFKFEFFQEPQTVMTSVGQPDSRQQAGVPIEERQLAPSINAALEKMGLRLENVKAPRGFLVIDHIERPTPNLPESIPPARAAGPGGLR